MTDKTQYFHFTLGPVQSFVGQARRTRDFWAGSFILSWLSGVAMLAVKAQGGRIIFPKAEDAFLDAISGKGEQKPQQGSIPNRFKAEVPDGFKGQLVVQAVQDAWLALADQIYKKDIKPTVEHFATIMEKKFSELEYDKQQHHKIWQRQVEAFWDMSWVISEDEADSSVLDRRKNWRNQYLPDEPGIKCTLMGDWQELSGMVGVRRKERLARKAFWDNIARQFRTSDFSDEREQLCAMAYIKRRFDKYFREFKATVLNESLKIHGWKVPSSVPSISYIAAAPWFSELVRKNNRAPIPELQTFIDVATAPLAENNNKKYLPEREAKIKCIRDASDDPDVFGIDGNMFHEIALDNPNVFPKNKTHPCVDWDRAQKTKETLKPLLQKYGAVSPFYAVLMMDGDSLGKQMSDPDKQTPISAGLSAFTEKVPKIVKEYNGFLIYAGGDDVLALITLEDALDCAAHLRMHYQRCFAKQNQEQADPEKHVHTTISAAILYTHINTPLKNILQDVHDLLDNVAKDGAGRDAIAIRVHKGSGIALEWAKKWDDALKEDTNNFYLNDIIKLFKIKNKSEAKLSNNFFYKIKQRIRLYDEKKPLTFTKENLIDLLCVDFIQSKDNNNTSLTVDSIMPKNKSGEKYYDQVNNLIRDLVAQCTCLTQNSIKEKEFYESIKADAALLVRFLAQKGIERGGE